MPNNDESKNVYIYGNDFLEGELNNYHIQLKRLVNERTAALRESNNRYEALIKSLPVGVFQIDFEGKCYYINEQSSSILGRPFDELIGVRWQEAIHPEDREKVVREWIRCYRKQTPFYMELKFIKPKGDIVWAVARANLYIGNGNQVCYVGTLRILLKGKLQKKDFVPPKSAFPRPLMQALPHWLSYLLGQREFLMLMRYLLSIQNIALKNCLVLRWRN
ncbi:hypothetical protein N752_27775 [Desulforamulus aquiferis]|nr:PAS domain-containing protein [Desulforamulus aquiferis]RYD01927.1 hypothetical protein N752_27775 [Desulforamulus aquiferis]